MQFSVEEAMNTFPHWAIKNNVAFSICMQVFLLMYIYFSILLEGNSH